MTITQDGSYQVGRFAYIDDEGGQQSVMLRVTANLYDTGTFEDVLLMSAEQALDLAAELIAQASLCGGLNV